MTTRESTPLGELRVSKSKSGVCEVHDWPSEGMGERLVKLLRSRFPGRVKVCIDCVLRARDDAAAARDQ